MMISNTVNFHKQSPLQYSPIIIPYSCTDCNTALSICTKSYKHLQIKTFIFLFSYVIIKLNQGCKFLIFCDMLHKNICTNPLKCFCAHTQKREGNHANETIKMDSRHLQHRNFVLLCQHVCFCSAYKNAGYFHNGLCTGNGTGHQPGKHI